MKQLELLDVKYGILEYDQDARVVSELGIYSTQVKDILERMSWRGDATGLSNVRLVYLTNGSVFSVE